MPRASALVSPAVKAARRAASTQADARAQTLKRSERPVTISTPTTADAAAGTSAGGTIR
jgi:hypothetical protein